MNPINEEKKTLRKEMLDLRNGLTKDEYLNKNKSIEKLFNSLEFRGVSQNFMSYVNMGKEVSTREIIKSLLGESKVVSVPLCVTKTTELVASQIHSLGDLEPSNFGLLEPKPELVRPVQPGDIDVVLIPGLAFDRMGNRLGYGKGYYDRFLTKLSSKALKVGLAYSFQIIERVPVDHLDVPLDMLITEEEIITF